MDQQMRNGFSAAGASELQPQGWQQLMGMLDSSLRGCRSKPFPNFIPQRREVGVSLFRGLFCCGFPCLVYRVSPNFSVLFYCNISNINFKMCRKHLFKDRKLAFQVIQFCYFALLLTGNRACRSQTYTVGMQPVLQKCSSSLNFNLLSQAKGTFHYSCLNFILKDSFLLHCWGQTLDLAHSRQALALHHVAACVCCPKIPKVFFICYLMTQIPKLVTWYTVGYDQANLTFISFNLPFSMLFRI